MLSLTLPAELNRCLGESDLAHAVRLCTTKLASWFGDKAEGLFFFPEYTDHGTKHISSVLTTAEALIRKAAWEHFTAEDAAVLILATFLHDTAMHLSADGLLHLSSGEKRGNQSNIFPLDDKSWPQLLDQFFSEARRWDSLTLYNVLGDKSKSPEDEEDLVAHIRHISNNKNPENWTRAYRKLLGEFVRRNHARLAHEIACFGIPGSQLHPLKEAGIPDHIADLAGLVARSHNISIRDTFPYLRTRWAGHVTCHNTHPIFLMVILRIADYLQVTSDRVNPTLLQVQRLRNPISQDEWDAHLAVHEVRPDEYDSEALFIFATPPSARTFLKLQKLIKGLQAELDTSWAILGEVFSLRGSLAKLGLTLRRIKSNLDDPAQFVQSHHPSYLPMSARFDTAGPDLLKLLIRPLYGDRPEVAIRELLQNSLDSVRELRQFFQSCGSYHNSSNAKKNSEFDVLISIESDNYGLWLTVTDSGIGMNANIIVNYFLKAGASYRNSDTWKRIFEIEGKSKVARSGRFGIGALAAFLLGNRLEVQTRHAEESPENGIKFSASITDDAIELWREPQPLPGTTIRIKLRDSAAEELRPRINFSSGLEGNLWDWYTWDEPRVKRTYLGRPLDQRYSFPPPGTKPNSSWKSFSHRDFPWISWSFDEAPAVICNGLIIGKDPEDTERKEFSTFKRTPFQTPSISVLDPDGRFPLTLQRYDVDIDPLPFEADLLQSISEDFLSFLLAHSPTTPPGHNALIAAPLRTSYFSIGEEIELDYLWSNETGTALLHPWHIKESQLDKILILLRNTDFDTSFFPKNIERRCRSAVARGSLNFTKLERVIRKLLLEDKILPDIHFEGIRLLVPLTEDLYRINFQGVRTRHFGAGWRILERGKTQNYTDFFEPLYNELESSSIFSLAMVVELYLDPTKIQIQQSPFTSLLANYFKTPIVPYDLKSREMTFENAFSQWRDHLETWQDPQLKGWRRDLVEGRSTPPQELSSLNLARNRFNR